MRPRLRRGGRHQLGGRGGEALGTTALVHEPYLKLGKHSRLAVEDRHHFFAVAAKAMRQIVVDHARRTMAKKRGGADRPLSLEEDAIPVAERAAEIVALDDALERLASIDEPFEPCRGAALLRWSVRRRDRQRAELFAAHRQA